jgi:RimJ/RimL family protein N-acetyltransferase
MITGERIILRAWQKADLETFTRWFDDPEVTIYLGNAYPALSYEEEERFYESTSQQKHRYCIVTKDEGVLIGNCAIHGIDTKNRSAEMGIVIGEKAYWNKGYGREALTLLMEIGFEGLGLNRMWLQHVDFNERGHRCYLAAGLTEEGRARQANFVKGAFHDDVIMSILSEEYAALKAAKAR